MGLALALAEAEDNDGLVVLLHDQLHDAETVRRACEGGSERNFGQEKKWMRKRKNNTKTNKNKEWRR